MNPQVEAAVIAGIVSIVSLGGTVAVAIFGFRTTVKATKMTADEAHTDTAATLEAQRVQLDRTLREQHIRTLNERFATAAEKLGSDKPPAVRLAGEYAMAGLADDWEDNRQTCVDVLCAYLRLRYVREPGDGEKAQMAFQDDREVRHTVIRVIAAHLKHGAAVSWQGLNFDFTGVVFDGGNFNFAQFSGGQVSFVGAEFSGGAVTFNGAQFTGGQVSFMNAQFTGGQVSFSNAQFTTTGLVIIIFDFAQFTGGTVSFMNAQFTIGGNVSFSFAEFTGGRVTFNGAQFTTGGRVTFNGAQFTGGTVEFGRAEFTGGQVSFMNTQFTGGTVDFAEARTWSHPPLFDWQGTPPAGVKLPAGIGDGAQ